MDTIKILLVMTVALLVGALAMSWKNFQSEQRATPPAELAAVRRQIAEIQQEQQKLKDERDALLHGKPEPVAPAPPAASDGSPAPADATVATAPESDAVFPAADDAVTPGTPSEPPLPGPVDRAKAISSAPVLARVAEWVEAPQLGTFATVEILDPDRVKAGTILCVRRNSGILGKLKVSEVTPDGAIANALSEFTGLKPKAGDELIAEPQ